MKYGIEYELEDARNVVAGDEWNVTTDGTLRGDGGREFVFRQPEGRGTALRMVDSLITGALVAGATISHRCSTHIHVDCRHLNGLRKLAMYVGLVGHEHLFYSYGTNRERNAFCVPTAFSPNVMLGISKAARAPNFRGERRIGTSPTRQAWPSFGPADLKYTGVNVCPLKTLGSIELRHFDPIMDLDDMAQILEIIETIDAEVQGVSAISQKSMYKLWENYESPDDRTRETLDWMLLMCKQYFQLDR